MKMTTAMVAVIWLTVLTAASGQVASSDPFDLIIRHGTVIDGTGAAPFKADVAIAGRHIVRIGDLSGQGSKREINATGLYVAPGFINLHSHASLAALATAENMLTQGVTTELLNPDGGGRTDIAEQLAEAASGGLAVNIGAYIGFNSAWSSVVGDVDRRPSPEDIGRMREIMTSNLDRGAWGVSAGLDYKPAYYATAEEVVEVVKAAQPYRTNFTNHDRVRPETKYSSRAGVAETIGIGARAGLVPVVTHMKVQGHEQGSATTTLALMRDATNRGNYTAADVYPYLAGQTALGALLVPGWALDGGREQMLGRFKDPSTRSRIVSEVEEAMTARFGGPQGVFLPATRQELIDVMRELNAGAGEAVVRLLETENQGAILRFGAEQDLIKILQHPTSSIACDCGASLPPRGSHPRNYGTYPRVLGRYVRETKALTWQDAVRKMTLLPAVTIGMTDRGAIAVGMVADVTVFDPATVIDRATYEEPTLLSEGIRHVVVNGVVALHDGKVTGERAGQVMRRARNMPSRPMPSFGQHLVTVNGSISRADDPTPLTVTIDVATRQGARRATGLLRIAKGSDVVLNARDFGIIQTAPGWASLTAVGRTASGAAHAVQVAVEQSDPWREDRAPSITVAVEGLFEAHGRADARIR
jgi:N-acyl-D-amino-acid deacylase